MPAASTGLNGQTFEKFLLPFIFSKKYIIFDSWTDFNKIGHSLCLPLLRASTDGRCTCFVRWGSFCTTGTPLVRRGCTIAQWEIFNQSKIYFPQRIISGACISFVLEIKSCVLGSRIRYVDAYWYKTGIKIIYLVLQWMVSVHAL